MLLDRSKPSVRESFGDYLELLSDRNGFHDLRSFKAFLRRKSKHTCHMDCSYINLFSLIFGLYSELGFDQRSDPNSHKYICFRCMNKLPKKWDWRAIPRQECYSYFKIRKVGIEPEVIRDQHCGLNICKIEHIGLPYPSKKAGLFFADMFSINERNVSKAPRIYPEYKAFLRV